MAASELLAGKAVVCCKSGKDRTSMAITLEQGRLVRETCGLGTSQVTEVITSLRKDGVRRENCRKNVGKPLYSFSPFQMHFLPKVLVIFSILSQIILVFSGLPSSDGYLCSRSSQLVVLPYFFCIQYLPSSSSHTSMMTTMSFALSPSPLLQYPPFFLDFHGTGLRFVNQKQKAEFLWCFSL